MIKNIIFDMGNVLVKFDKEHYLDAFGVVDKKDREILYKEVYESKEWPMIDKGILSDSEAYESIIKRIPSHLHLKAYDLIFNWDKKSVPVDGTAEYIKELKQRGYKIYLLSNASKRALTDYWPSIKGHEYFDGKVVSAFIKMVKPEDGIYQYLLNEFNLDPKECVFIDDMLENVEASKRNGIDALLFKGNIENLRIELEKKLKEN